MSERLQPIANVRSVSIGTNTVFMCTFNVCTFFINARFKRKNYSNYIIEIK